MSHLHRRRSGLALVLMLIVLALGSVFLLVSARLFTETVRSTKEAQQAQQRAVRIDGMLERLRADVWQANLIEVADGVATLTLPGTSVTWTLGKDRSVKRQAANELPATFEEAGAGLRLEAQGGNLLVHLSESGDQLVLTSQAIRAAGGVR